jgi:hypothetical protein
MAAPDVRAGQVWADNDSRSRGRTLRIDLIEKAEPPNTEDVAVCTVLTAPPSMPVGKQTRIMVRRFRPNSTGYKLVKDVPRVSHGGWPQDFGAPVSGPMSDAYWTLMYRVGAHGVHATDPVGFLRPGVCSTCAEGVALIRETMT